MASADEKAGRRPWGLIAATLGLLVIRAAVAAGTGLTDDEAYYRLWGLAPALSYLDHPAMTGWLIAMGRMIAGDTPFGLRLAAVLAPVLGTLLLWRTTRILFGRLTAERAAWIGLAMPLMMVGGVVMTPDVPSVMTFGLTGWAMAELYCSRRPAWWLAVGLFAGLGLMSKYTNLFAGAGIVLWLLLSPRNRAWLATPWPWAGGAIAVAGALPPVIWNAEHHWASFDKQFGRVAAGEGLTLRFFFEFLGSTFGLLSPAIAALAAIGLWHATRAAWRDRNSPEALVLCSVLPLSAYLLIHSLHDRVQANWPGPLYPSLAILAALAVPVAAPWLWRVALPMGLAIGGVVYLHAAHPLLVLDGEADPTAQMRGWPQFAAEVEAKREAVGAGWIATSSYATTAQLADALPPQVPVLQLNERIRYINLPAPPPGLAAEPVLYVELQRRAEPSLLHKRYANVRDLGTLTRSSGRAPLDVYALYLASSPTRDPLDPASQSAPAAP